ncbi:cytochrome P450 [Streptomyces sp. NPDC088387]|uniref:cytochrome P450 n=1 Tax=Streptomyces sp. NPDC088387 TaxID=3365859 RepID=UPI0037F79D6F
MTVSGVQWLVTAEVLNGRIGEGHWIEGDRNSEGRGESAEARRPADVPAAAMTDVLTVGRAHRPTDSVDTCSTPPSLMWTQFETNPFPVYARLRRDFPLVRDESLDAWVVSRYADVRAALCDPRLAPPDNTLRTARADHTPLRTVLSAALRNHAPTNLRRTAFGAAEELAWRAAAEIRRCGSTDLVPTFCEALPVQVLTAALGLPSADAPRLRLSCNAAASKPRLACLEPHIAARRSEPGDDLLSTLCAAEIEGRPLTDQEIQRMCAVLLTAGARTTEKALALFLTNLVDHPDAQAAVAEKPDLVHAAWAESLRRDPPTHVVFRRATEAVDLPSGTIPAGATVACLPASANRDPAHFADPDHFDIRRPERDEFAASAENLAFGAGERSCLGAHLARLLGETVSALLHHLPHLRWTDGFTPTPQGLINRSTPRLRVTARP